MKSRVCKKVDLNMDFKLKTRICSYKQKELNKLLYLPLIIMIYLYNLYKSMLQSTFLKKNYLCRVEDINENGVAIYSRGTRLAMYLNFNTIMNDLYILENCPPKQAALIGFFYGKYYYNMLDQKNHYQAPFNFFKNTSLTKYLITAIDRKGNLSYLDQNSGLQTAKQPIEIVTNHNLIGQFTSLQAFYIGVLSGITQAKSTYKTTVNPTFRT